MRKLLHVLLVIVALGALTGCKKKATCADAARKAAQIEGVPSPDVAKSVQEITKKCLEQKVPQATLDCVMTAKTDRDLQVCDDDNPRSTPP